MKNYIMWSGMSPLTIRCAGSGAYVKEQCANLANLWYFAEQDHYESIRQDYKHNEEI